MKKIELYSEIDYWAFNQLNSELKEADGQDVEIYIKSGGGATFEGFAMASLISDYSGNVKTIGIGVVASAATTILMAGDEIVLDEDCMFMIHNAWTWAAGDKDELRKQAEIVEKVTKQIEDFYMRNLESNGSELTREELTTMMDEETWLTAQEALNLGFITSIKKAQKKSDPVAIMASINKFNYKNLNFKMSNKKKTKSLTARFFDFLNGISEEDIKAMKEEEAKNMDDDDKQNMDEDDKKKSMTKEELEALAKENGYELVEVEDMDEDEEKKNMDDDDNQEVANELKNELESLKAKLAEMEERKVVAAPSASKTKKRKRVKTGLENVSADIIKLFNKAGKAAGIKEN
ncbi:MAG: Clp protease ClpP [Cytophagales bacterium]|nr:Clp protease ClpP [Cytophagales bacterium]